jgi:RING-type zinc-finger
MSMACASRRVDLDDVALPASRIEGLICAVCHGLLQFPVETICGHTFCRSCVTPACPLCRTLLESPTGLRVREPSLAFNRLLSDLAVRCPHGPADRKRKAGAQGCDWKGSYGDLLGCHIDKCLHEPVTCELCKTTLRRGLLAEHQSGCVAMLACGICGASVSASSHAEHNVVAAQQHVELLTRRCADLQHRAAEDLQRARVPPVVWDIPVGKWSSLRHGRGISSRRITLDSFGWGDAIALRMHIFPQGSGDARSGDCSVRVHIARASCTVRLRVSLSCGLLDVSREMVRDLSKDRHIRTVVWPGFCQLGAALSLRLQVEVAVLRQLVRSSDSSSDAETSEDS